MAVEVKRGLTIKSLTLGTVILLVYTVISVIHVYTETAMYNGSLMAFEGYADSRYYYYFWGEIIFTSFVVFLLLSLLRKRLGLTPQEYTVLFVFILFATPMLVNTTAVTYAWWWLFHSMASGRLAWYVPAQLEWMAPYYWFGTPADHLYINGGYVGRPLNVAVPVRWGPFLTIIGYNGAQVMFSAILMISLAAILRKQYLETEALPFPLVTTATELIRETTTVLEGATSWWSKRPGLLRNKWLGIGFLVAQALSVTGYIWWIKTIAAPGLDIKAFKPVIDIIVPTIPIMTQWMAPHLLGFSLLMPLDVLISFFIVWIVIVVGLTNVLWMGGVFPPMPAASTMTSYVSRAQSYLIIMSPPGIGMNGIAYGVFLVGAIFPLFVHRGDVMSTLRAVFKPKPELEKDEALSYRWLYLIAILGFLGYIALFAFTTPAVVWIGAISLIMAIILWTGISRLRAETGGWGGYAIDLNVTLYPNFNQLWPRLTLLNVVGTPSTAGERWPNSIHFNTIQMSQGYWKTLYAGGMGSLPMSLMLEAFSLAKSTRTRARDIFVTGIITLVLTFFLGSVLMVWIFHTANWSFLPATITSYWNGNLLDSAFTPMLNSRGTPLGARGYWYMGYGAPAGPDVPGTLTVISSGIIIAVVLFWIRTRYPAFIFNPWAIPLWFGLANAEQFWFMALIALLLKYLTIRVYGAKTYENKLLPLSLGLIIGAGFFFAMDRVLFFAFIRKFA